jgi:hypothetical protein
MATDFLSVSLCLSPRVLLKAIDALRTLPGGPRKNREDEGLPGRGSRFWPQMRVHDDCRCLPKALTEAMSKMVEKPSKTPH